MPHTLVYPTERLSLGYLISYLRWVMGLYEQEHPGEPTLYRLFCRLCRLSSAFDQLIARHRAGTLPAPRPFRPRRPPASRRQMPPMQRRSFGWLQRGVGWRCTHCRSFLEYKLADPEMQALIAATPAQARRVFRPLCHLLGVTPPPSLALPPRPRRPRPQTLTSGAPETDPPDPDPPDPGPPDPAERPGLSPEMRQALRRFPRLGATRIPRDRSPRAPRPYRPPPDAPRKPA